MVGLARHGAKPAHLNPPPRRRALSNGPRTAVAARRIGWASPALHRRVNSIRADDNKACRKIAVLAALGRNEDGRAGLEVRLRGGTEGDDRDAVGNQYLLLLTLVGDSEGAPVDVLDHVQNGSIGHRALGLQNPKDSCPRNDASFCAAALEEALLRFGKPRIFNTDQGSTFTAEAFAGKLAAAGVAISMDGRGRFMDNIFIERLSRSIKYEEVHLKAYADGREARAGIGSWMTFYNFRRPHQAMSNQMPIAVWRAGMDKIEAAARAVDMPLRLDNANALPTYPQQKQKQQKRLDS